jgi:nucleoside-diphosphate-sugar epimerase
MSLHLIVGAGPVGSATARLLAARGEQVRLITRSGSKPQPIPSRSQHGAEVGGTGRLVGEAGAAAGGTGQLVGEGAGGGGIECVAADASDGDVLARHAEGAAAL